MNQTELIKFNSMKNIFHSYLKKSNLKFYGALVLALIFLLIIQSCSDNSDDSSSSSSSTSTWTGATTSCTSSCSSSVNTPDNFNAILLKSVSITPASKSSVSDLDRVLIGYSSSYMSLDNSSYTTVGLDSTLSTYNDVFLKTFQLVADNSSSPSCYRADSEKHSNYSVDYNSSSSNRLYLRNTFGYERESENAADNTTGYLCFTHSSSLLTASKRFKYDNSTNGYTQDTSFSTMYVAFDSTNSIFKLVSSSSSASSITLYDTGALDLTLPSSFNPNSSSMVTNSRVEWSSYATHYDNHTYTGTYQNKLYNDTHSSYQSQVESAGDNSTTSSAASTMLSTIKSDLESAGSSLRYDTSVYLAFRDALLKTKVTGETIVGAPVGLNTAPNVFFTNECLSGVRHPFMVIFSWSISDRPNRLLDVPVPPGDGTGSYPDSNVTRDAVLQTFLHKIPLKDYGEVSSVTDNTLSTSLATDASSSTYTVYSHASISTIGLAVDGVQIYPVYNNTLLPAVEKAEITSSGIHVGQGMGLHWHGDGHGATGNGLNLYNLPDYVGSMHPPLIGFGLDGVALYGKYESSYDYMDGYTEDTTYALDTFGGHDHGDYNYHYHAQGIANGDENGACSSNCLAAGSYTMNILMKGAWAGDIDSVPDFWNSNNNGKPATTGAQNNKWIGNKNYASGSCN